MEEIQGYIMYALIKLNMGPYINQKWLRIIFTIGKWPHTLQTKGEVGYVLKLATPKKKLHLALKPLEASKLK
jgi:hypothetical protein